MFGVGVDGAVGDRLMLTGSLLYEKTDGSADLSSQDNFGNPLPLHVTTRTARRRRST